MFVFYRVAFQQLCSASSCDVVSIPSCYPKQHLMQQRFRLLVGFSFCVQYMSVCLSTVPLSYRSFRMGFCGEEV